MEHEEDPSTASERLSHGNSQLVGLTPHRVRKKPGLRILVKGWAEIRPPKVKLKQPPDSSQVDKNTVQSWGLEVRSLRRMVGDEPRARPIKASKL